MAFDEKRFLKTKFQPRTEAVPVPDLAAFFPEGEKPLWIIRGLEGKELGLVNEAAARNKNVAAILEGLMAGDAKEKAKAVQKLLGTAGEVPEDVARRLEILVLGSVDPPCKPELAVRICEAYPVEFFDLTNRIRNLTGQGKLPGKQPPSGATEGSATPSPSATPEGGSSTK